ncbi:fimbrial protein [Stenotrophomonas maltophilia]|uniref:Fimbrial protein n=1 Tax=Stenotrophomonas maltophilia TaxID=40324 RepID=A0ABD7BZH3_STEMA|nr:fimbrial protein [Stenotrophomonas maltophilia]MBN5087326.1 fimbrial protein [Stenotrophomonas maltophilia]QQQ40541.1 fimbrial protein [Stenotrophomonas maltophilia]
MAKLEVQAMKRWTAVVGMAGLGLVFSGAAWARCDKFSDALSEVVSTTLVTNGTSNGRPVSPWLPEHTDDRYIAGCTSGGTVFFFGHRDQIGSYSENGLAYSVYASGIEGLGMIFAVRSRDDGGPFVPIHADSSSTINFRQQWMFPQVRARFIRMADIAAGTHATRAFEFGSGLYSDGTSIKATVNYAVSSTTVTVVHRPLCRPLPVVVRMGSVPATDFRGQYSGSRSRGFQIQLDCESGVGEVRYYLEATDTSPIVDVDRGIVAVTGGAAGVGLQMLQSDSGTPIALEKVHPFGTSTDAGRISKQFHARYVQTAEESKDIQPGAANASIRIVMDYP